MTEEEKQTVIDFIIKLVSEIENVEPAVSTWLMQYYEE